MIIRKLKPLILPQTAYIFPLHNFIVYENHYLFLCASLSSSNLVKLPVIKLNVYG